MLQLEQELKSNAYPGRGIVIGRSANGKYAVTAYFIIGRRDNKETESVPRLSILPNWKIPV